MAVKLDMAKAYDRVEWFYIQKLLLKMDLHENFVTWMMKCVTIPTYRFKINGDIAGEVKPTRGLRQGDPLSPYLILLCAEGLSRILNQAEVLGDIQSLRLIRGGPTVNHIFFADDSFIFCNANAQNAAKISEILRTFEECLGQRVNFAKSAIFFSKNTSELEKDEIIVELGRLQRNNLGSYLGLPAVVGRLKKKLLDFIKDRVKAKIKDWKNNFLNPAGKK
ncbi:uncharacterized protein LOC132639530 [Lycium barbarum]|uniref:uncharacterized protein LOC132639530 n=1 Tax=Lycium barbarum TaxID=112863 RepID=UPI00293F52A2|nr:uncharacterized protein LOC132639530 [Lycium barbarum]